MQRIKIDKIESQVAPAEEAVLRACLADLEPVQLHKAKLLTFVLIYARKGSW